MLVVDPRYTVKANCVDGPASCDFSLEALGTFRRETAFAQREFEFRNKLALDFDLVCAAGVPGAPDDVAEMVAGCVIWPLGERPLSEEGCGAGVQDEPVEP